MSSRGRYEDLSTLLYLVPFLGAFGYAIVLWAESGASALLPTAVYLTVTRDPTLFIVGSLAILLGVMIEVNGTEAAERPAKLLSLGGTLQSVAVASLVVVILSAWYANGFTNLGGAATDFIVGRYGLVFPAMMVLFSYLLIIKVRLESVMNRNFAALVALLLVPASLYEVGKRQPALGVGIAFVLLVVGIFLYLAPHRMKVSEKEE
ncbi:MAG: hypothetical protein JRN06_02500 [Nitrososphaerota archaeon]|nr:hypothetical protein [Nitrososphaerota archaeon]MDG7023273.1 hypothetical protein [Nitrososphaerota archaeon]